MPARAVPLTPWTRGGLGLLCALVVASLVVRVEVSRRQPPPGHRDGREASDGPVDLGMGGLWPRAAAGPLTMRVAECAAPIAVDFVQASPYQPDPSLVGRPGPTDRVAYVYRGRLLDSRFITIRLNAIYLARLASARLTGERMPAIDELAVKVIVPAGCPVSPEAVMAALRDSAPPGALMP